MKAIILAAGRGSRLDSYGQDKPKCLIDLGGKSLIERQLHTLRSCGINDIVMVTGYRADMLSGLVGETRHNSEWEDTNMVETLFAANDLFGEDIIVSYADIVYEPRVLKTLLSSQHDCSVIIDKDWRVQWEARFEDPLSDAETLKLADDGVILEIGNPPSGFEEIEGQYIGLMRFSGAGINALRQARQNLNETKRPWMTKRPVRKAYMTDLLMEMILSGVSVYSVPVHTGWLEIDTAEDYERMQVMYEDGSIKSFFDPDA